MKDGNGTLIAYHLLKSSTGAYIEWLVNELMRLLMKIEYKNAILVMLLQMQNKPTSQIALHILGVFSFLLLGKSCRVQLSTQGFIPLLQATGGCQS